MVRVFFGIWIAYWLVAVLLPVEPEKNVFLTFSMQAIFVVFMGSSIALGSAQLRASMLDRTALTHRKLHRIVTVLSLAVVMAPILLVIDKVVINEIDYSQGLTSARSAQSSAENSTTVFSILGYIFLSQVTVLMYLALTHVQMLSRKRFLFVFLISTLAVFIFSILIGGRSPIFVFFTVVLTIYIINFRVQPKHILWIGGITLIVVGYSGYIFFDRINVSGMSPGRYVAIFMYWLRMAPTETVADMSATSAIFTLIGAYFAHSFYVASEVLSIDWGNTEGRSIFFFLQFLGARLGIFSQPVEWPYSGVFSSITGQLYFQFGLFGHFVAIFIYSKVIYICFDVLARRPRGTMLPYLGYMLISSVILTPMLVPLDFIFFPFAFVFGGMGLLILNKLL